EARAGDDPFTWMEEIEGERALTWAKAENARSLPRLQNDPRYAGLYAEAQAIATAPDRIPGIAFAGGERIRDFWQDRTHVRGLWRETDLASYRSGAPAWRTILDVDALAKSEGGNWVFAGVDCLAPDNRLCLVSLSDGGKDAVTVREFDAREGRFLDGGFRLPEGKHRFDWIDRDTLLVVTALSPAESTVSGYPYVARLLTRGQTLAEAPEVFRGDRKDGGYGVNGQVFRNAGGEVEAVILTRPLDTFSAEHHLLAGNRTLKLALPLRSTVQALVAGRLVVSLEADWAAAGLKAGDLVDFDLAAVRAAPEALRPELVLRPTESQSVEQVASTRDRLVIGLLDNVRGQVRSLKRSGGGWSSETLALPVDSTLTLTSVSRDGDRILVSAAGYLSPTSQWLADASGGAPERLRSLPARFDASNMIAEQHWAVSKDGTRVPYSVVRRKDAPMDGSNPTLLYAYGGFLVSQTPAYAATPGKLWVERGGIYVVANIRGGGEFGPRWHNAGLKLDRMRVYEDFFAVSEDLIRRGYTSPRRLGIMGGSNGGLLMGVALTQRPELYNAVVIQVPLFDMIRYTQIGAGASWVGEYGDPAIPAEREMLLSYSPYQNLKAGRPYPSVFLVTSTKDDRVHPAHARKAAARLGELGYDYLYYENMDGGHAAAANLNERALRQALEYTYLMQRLVD
ncbi:prolyl oligopeptidase family serine peptidase, partial [Phenylobacterium sp.]|uniref:prolyl oligopeptidase family serine peptidase n=1 Tax=Phenylobacterium sp. TaxID=1871053 RepID=UPI0025D9A787